MNKSPAELSVVSEIIHPDGNIVVTEADRSHMIDGHFSSSTPGSKFVEPFEAVLDEVRGNLPESLEYDEAEDIHIEIECGRVIGITGIARRVDLYNAGAIDAETFGVLDETEPEIFVRNLMDTEEEKQAFVDEFNQRFSSERCRLIVRANSICVLVESELAETDSFVAVLNPIDYRGAVHRLATMFPGPDMPRLPGDAYFKGSEAGWCSSALSEMPLDRRRVLQAQQLGANRRWSEFAFLQPPQ